MVIAIAAILSNEMTNNLQLHQSVDRLRRDKHFSTQII